MQDNLAPWIQPFLDPRQAALQAYQTLAQVAREAAIAQSVDCPIASAIIDSLRSEIEAKDTCIAQLEARIRELDDED
jgi:hypothetical protein